MKSPLLSLFLVALATTVVRADETRPLAVFECREITGWDRARTLVADPLDLPRGQAKAGTVKLVDAAGAAHWPVRLPAHSFNTFVIPQ